MFTQTTSSFVWDCVWQSTLWLALGGLASRLWRHWPARAHRVLLLALLGCLATPLLSLTVRQLGWGMLTRPTAEVVSGHDDESLSGLVPNFEGKRSLAATQAADKTQAESVELKTPVLASSSQPFPGPEASGTGVSLSGPGMFVCAWVILSTLVLARLTGSVVRELSVLRKATPTSDVKVRQAVEQALRRLNLDGTLPETRVSDQIRCPVIYCWGRRPTLLLPDSVVRTSACEDLIGLISHELAHWKRRDHWSALAGELAVCFIPWQPLAWWVKRRLEHWSELACDHWVLAAGHPAEAYAESLLSLAPQRDATLALPAVKHRGKLGNRIRRILQNRNFNPTVGWKWTSVATVAVGSLAIAMAAFQTQSNAASSAKDENTASQDKTKIAPTPATGSTGLVIKKLDLPEEALLGRLSPDLGRVARITGVDYHDIAVIDLRSRVTVRVSDHIRESTTNQYPDILLWSRDGGRLAFNYFPSGRNGSYSLRLGSTVGAEVKTIYESKDLYPNPCDWSQDGKWILVALYGDASMNFDSSLVLIPTEGGSTQQIVGKGWNGKSEKLSKDGKFVAFQRRNNQGRDSIFLLSIADGREIPIGPPDRSNSSPHWSADGRYLLFKSDLTDASELLGQELVNGRLVRDPVLIKSELGRSAQIGQVLDDGRLVYQTISPGGGGTFRVAMNPDSGEVAGEPRLVMVGGDGTPSPDGRWLAGVSSGGLRVVSLERNDQRTIGMEIENLKVYGWFPDGNSILVGRGGGTLPRGLHQFELATGKLTTVYTNIAVNSARLSSDGQMLVVDRGSQLFVVKPELAATPIKVRSRGNSPSWSPDRSRIAFIIGAKRLVTTSATGEDLRELDHWDSGRVGGHQTAWSPNGKHIVYLKAFQKSESNDGASQVWIVSASGGEPAHLKSLDGYGAHNFYWSAGGKELFFTGRDPKSGPATEYWTLENYLPEEKRAAK